MRNVLISLVIAPALQGCFFFMIPGSAMQAVGDAISGNSGNLCVAENAYVGQKVNMPAMPAGTLGTVKKIEGASSRCNNPALPIRAVVQVDA